MRLNHFALLLWVVAASPALAGTIEWPERDNALRAAGVRSPQAQTVSTPSPWLRKVDHSGIVYLLYTFPPRVERYSLQDRQWLNPIALSAVPRGLAVSDLGIFVTQNTRVSRFDLGGASEQLLPGAWTDASDLGITNNYLLTSRNGEIQSYNISTLSEIDVIGGVGSYHIPRRIAVARSGGAIYGWTHGISPADMLRIAVNPDGTFGDSLSSPYHGDFPAGTYVYTDANGSVVIDEAGIVFNGIDLTYTSGTGGPINDVAILADRRVLLRDQSVTLIDTQARELGVASLDSVFHSVAVFGNNLHLFADTGSGPNVTAIPIDNLVALPTGAIRDPLEPYSPSQVDIAQDGIIYLSSTIHRVVHRFSVPQWTYLSSVPLPLTPTFTSVDQTSGRVYTAYDGGRLGVIPPGTSREQFLAYSPVSVIGLGAAEDLVMTCDYTGAWESHRIFNIQGEETEWREWNHYSREFRWNSANRRMYFFRDGTSPNDLHFETVSQTGQITQSGETPYHGTVQTTLPIRPSPDGSLVLLGSGQAYDAISLDLAGTLPVTPLNDAAWIGNSLFTTHPLASPNLTRLIRWALNGSIAADVVIAGTNPRLLSYGGELISVTMINGRPSIQRWPGSLTGTNLSVTFADSTPPGAPGSPATFTIEATNHGLSSTVSATLDVQLNGVVPGLSWYCEGPSGVVACGGASGTALTISLSPGEKILVQGSGSLPSALNAPIEVRAEVSMPGGDLNAADNVETRSLEVLNVVFQHGFED